MAEATIINSGEQQTAQRPFIPNLCTLQALFLLVLLGELLALSMSLVASGLSTMDWSGFGLRSFMIQWVVLLSAALLCPLRPWLAQVQPWVAGLSSFGVVMLVTGLCSAVGHFAMMREWPAAMVLLDHLVLAAIFAGVVLRFLYLQQQLHNQQKAELQARIQALQSRIQPHFLFNSLNSIASLIETDPEVAESMVEDLASLFRASLSEPGLISLQQELSLCRQYVGIEQRRLGQRLQVHWQIDDQVQAHLSEIKIPSLMLQPLLENAVHHGIQPLPDGGEINLRLTRKGSQLCIDVSNPVPAEDNTRLPHRQGNRMALENIQHRLQAHFGSAASFITREQGDQYRVEICYPFPVLNGSESRN